MRRGNLKDRVCDRKWTTAFFPTVTLFSPEKVVLELISYGLPWNSDMYSNCIDIICKLLHQKGKKQSKLERDIYRITPGLLFSRFFSRH